MYMESKGLPKILLSLPPHHDKILIKLSLHTLNQCALLLQLSSMSHQLSTGLLNCPFKVPSSILVAKDSLPVMDVKFLTVRISSRITWILVRMAPKAC